MSVGHQFKVLQSLMTSLVEPTKGAMGTPRPKQPQKSLKLFDMEGCPYCRRVRQALTVLNLDVEIYPCPKNGTRYRPVAQALLGENKKPQFPMLLDDNTGELLVESQKIIDYLFKNYGETGTTPTKFQNMPKIEVKGSIASMISRMRGLKAEATNAKRDEPDHLLELWSFEFSPYTRLVRERLCELEVAYKLVNVAKERWQDVGPAKLRLKPGKYLPQSGGKRDQLYQQYKVMQMPFLIDPNTQTQMVESEAILHYLNRQYG